MDKLSRRMMLKGLSQESQRLLSRHWRGLSKRLRYNATATSSSRSRAGLHKETPLDQLCAYAAQVGLKAVDLLSPDECEVPKRFGTMGLSYSLYRLQVTVYLDTIHLHEKSPLDAFLL